MKKLMLGNAAVAEGLYDAGVSFVSSYPGTPSTEITERISEYRDIHTEWAPNEKVALEAAFGASLGGVRAFCGMKHVGLNVAADPLFTMSYTGVNAGLVIAVADDPGMHSSQNEQDSRHYAIASKVPMLEPADSSECYEYAKLALTLSEEYDTPVLLRMITRISHSQSLAETTGRIELPIREYKKDIAKYVMMPGNAIRRHPIVEERTARLIKYAETSGINRIERAETGSDIGIITSGTAYQYVKEVFGDTVSVLKLGLVNPLPVKLIKKFAESVSRLFVVEELDPIIENHVRALGISVTGKELLPICGELSQSLLRAKFGKESAKGAIDAAIPEIPARPPVMCPGCPHRGIFYSLKKQGISVLGDIGCYTLGAAAPLAAIDTTLCMGASISGLHGFIHADSARAGSTVAVIGDSTFVHSGITGLINIAYNGGNATVIILDNSITGMTGHQQNPTTGLDIHGDPAGKIDLTALVRSLGIERVRVVDPYNLEECETALSEELAAPEPSVIISRRPCALLKTVKHNKALCVDPEKCKKCKACMRIGCPSVSMTEEGAVIDANSCVGCSVCEQLCKFDAIGEGK